MCHDYSKSEVGRFWDTCAVWWLCRWWAGNVLEWTMTCCCCSWSWNMSRLVSLLRGISGTQSPRGWASRRRSDCRASETARRDRRRHVVRRRRAASPGGHLSTRPFRHELRPQRRHHAQRTLHQTEVAASIKVVRKSYRLMSAVRRLFVAAASVPSAAPAVIDCRKLPCLVRNANMRTSIALLTDG